MKTFPFKKIDVFTKGTSAGNPAGCIYLSKPGDISEGEMQFIASELKGFVNEVIYLFPEKDGIFFRYYSAECEVDFCGHGTLGALYDFIGTHADLLDTEIMKIRVKSEVLEVYNRLQKEDCVYITAPRSDSLPLKLSNEQIAQALQIKPEDIAPGIEPAILNAGLNTLVVPIRSLQSCLHMNPDEAQLKAFCSSSGIDIVLVFTPEVADKRNSYRTRVFAPKFGYLEDPATGSGNSALGYHLLGRGTWDGSTLNIEQNDSFDCPNSVKLATVEKDGKILVIFGGAATVKIDGHYKLA